MSERQGDRASTSLGLMAMVQCGLACAFLTLWIGMAVRGDFWRADFSAFYFGWRMVLEGQGDHLYDRELQKEYQARYVPERVPEGGLLAFVNPPHAALALAPLAWLPRSIAFYAWTALQLGFLWLTLRWLLEWCAVWPAQERWLLIATILAFPPLFMTFQLGQVSLAGLLCLTGFYRSLRRDEAAVSAAWLVLGTFKPQLMLVPAVTLLATRRWRALGWSVLFFGAWSVVTSVLLGWRCWLGFLEITRHNTQLFGSDGIDPLRMYNLKGLLTALLGSERGDLINGVTAAATLVALLATAWIWRGTWRVGASDFEGKAALSLQLGLVCNPHFNPADALCLVLPALLFLIYLRRNGRPWQPWAMFVVTWPELFALDSYAAPNGWPGDVRPFFLVMLLALAWMAVTVAGRSAKTNGGQDQALREFGSSTMGMPAGEG